MKKLVILLLLAAPAMGQTVIPCTLTPAWKCQEQYTDPVQAFRDAKTVAIIGNPNPKIGFPRMERDPLIIKQLRARIRKLGKRVVEVDEHPDVIIQDVEIRSDQWVPDKYRWWCDEYGCHDNAGGSWNRGGGQVPDRTPMRHVKAAYSWALINPKTGRRITWLLSDNPKKMLKQLGY